MTDHYHHPHPHDEPYLRGWDAAVIILAEHSESLLVAALQVHILVPVLHHGAELGEVQRPGLVVHLVQYSTVQNSTVQLSTLLMMSVTSTSVGLAPARLIAL